MEPDRMQAITDLLSGRGVKDILLDAEKDTITIHVNDLETLMVDGVQLQSAAHPVMTGGQPIAEIEARMHAHFVDHIASVCHGVNRAYCLALGDGSQPEWKDAPEWQKDSARKGVQFHLDNPDATPENSHEEWLKVKLADGWTYGEVKDVEKKTHPCFRPYRELPRDQRVKDYLFRAVVHALRD